MSLATTAKELRFYFIADEIENDPVLTREVSIISGEIRISGVQQMVLRILHEVMNTGGHIKSLVISSHGTVGAFYIGKDEITLRTLAQYSTMLGQLRPFFHPDAHVFIAACNVAFGKAWLLRRLSDVLGGVPVIGYPDVIRAVDGWFVEYMQYPLERVVCVLDKCRSELKWTWPHSNYPAGY